MKKNLPSTVEIEREIQRLERLVEDLQVEYAMLNTEVGMFEAAYHRRVGAASERLDQMQQGVQELLKIHTRASPRKKGTEKNKKNFSKVYVENSDISDEDSAEILSVPASLKAAYRSLVKRLHPDLVTDVEQREIRNRILAQANEAYRIGDNKTLNKIANSLNSEHFGTISSNLSKTIIAGLKTRLMELQQQLEKLKATETYKLMITCKSIERAGQDPYKHIVSSIEAKLNVACDYLRKCLDALD